MQTEFSTPTLTLEELSQRVEGLRRAQQSDKDKAVKSVQEQIEALRAELNELRELFKDYLDEEVTYEQQR